MGKLRDDARAENVTALRALRTDEDRSDFVRHRMRALLEHIDGVDEDGVLMLNAEAYKDLQWALALLDAWDAVVADLRVRAGSGAGL